MVRDVGSARRSTRLRRRPGPPSCVTCCARERAAVVHRTEAAPPSLARRDNGNMFTMELEAAFPRKLTKLETPFTYRRHARRAPTPGESPPHAHRRAVATNRPR
jgi:hypothetical protein